MTSDAPKLPDGVRLKRIEALLKELQYEIHIGIYEGDVTEATSKQFHIHDVKNPNHSWEASFTLRRRLYPMPLVNFGNGGE